MVEGKTLTTASLVLLVVAIVLGGVSLAGPEDVPWSKYEDDVKEVKYGLKELITTQGSTTVENAWDDCSSDVCEDCEKAGDATLSFVSIALVGNLVAVLLCYKRWSDGSTKFWVWAAAFAAAGCYAVAWSTWLGGCDQSLKDSAADEDDVQPAAGFALALVASVLAGLGGLFVMVSGDWA